MMLGSGDFPPADLVPIPKIRATEFSASWLALPTLSSCRTNYWKRTAFKWVDQCAQAFDSLRINLHSTLVLTLPEVLSTSERFILDTDTNALSIGSEIRAELSAHVPAYGSSCFRKTKGRKFCATRK